MKIFKIFYGWWIVAAAFITGLYMAGVVFYGFTTIFEPIAKELGWSYTQVSLASSIRGLEAGLLAPLVGLLADRWGPRRLVFSGVIFTFLGLLLLGQTQNLGMFYASFILLALGMSLCTMTVLMTAVSNWFHRRVGLASGIAISGFGFGGSLIPLLVRLIEAHEWRMTIIMLAMGALVLILPLSLVFRHKPEQYGYLPDGQPLDPIITNSTELPSELTVQYSVKQIIKRRVFWHMGLAFICQIMLISATVTHVMPYLSTINIIRSRASIVATAIPLTSIAGRLGLGWIGDKVDRRLVIMIAFAFMGIGILCFGYTSIIGFWLLPVFIFFFGVGYGGSIALRPSLVRDYYGRGSFGTAFGLVMGVSMIGGIIGPPLAGWAYDTWGSYQGIWFIFVACAVVALLSMLTAPPVNKPIISDGK